MDHDRAISQQGHYAGAVTRLVAYAIDQAVATGLYTLGVAVVTWIGSLVFSTTVETAPLVGWASVGYLLWLALYFGYPWAASGKSLGMAVLGLRVVSADGSSLSPKQALLRVVAFPLGFLTLGIGFLGILFGRHHQAIYDRIARSAVVYDWDARSARWRFLARQGPKSAAG
ncbi:MAG: RDD family protein [Actinomycetes bacterium]